ncbi:hypothetical protein AY601_1986 [Pedobacter cryoconitis]|uniref:Thioredoxin domain-containing protein n=1 Tax=Pedobacter cryoconitis TaxID=188932 RepID=A0A127VBW7_9SPHI|nr:TlpA disulfide reductase family protein [Pedobacter cryoconitis]AMP98892.1 hypothetical protein AY601_1986 [Pedobacter cryoconitis]
MNNHWFKIIAVSFFLFTISGTSLVPSAFGQAIGSKVPDLQIGGAFISGTQKSALSDLYKKGGLIINFWATWCAPCLKEQKRLDSLMQIYPELSVLSTTYEDSIVVRKHFEKNGMPKSRSMIITSNDKVFHDFFKHRVIPHNIWIDKNGIIKASTGGDEINEKNVKEFLEGNTSKLDIKNDDITFSALKTYHVPDSMIRFRSCISGFNNGITSGLLYGDSNEDKEFNRMFAWNRPITQFFWLGYTNQQNYRMNWNLIELDSSDSTRFIQPTLDRALFERSRYNNGDDFLTRKKRWEKDNLYCYEFMMSKSIKLRQSSEYMFPDLERFFNVKASTRKKRMICNVVKLDQAKFQRSVFLNKKELSLAKNSDSLIVDSLSINNILNLLLEKFTDNVPYINETGYGGLLSFKIISKNGKLTSQEIWARLNEFGLYKEEKKRSYEILVLKDLSHPGKR